MNVGNLSIKTTSKCNLMCPSCSVVPWMRANKGFETSLKNVKDFINYSQKSGYSFTHILLSGGEPLLWSCAIEASKMLRESELTGGLTLFTNGKALLDDLDKTLGIIENVHVFRIGRYKRSAEEVNKFLDMVRDDERAMRKIIVKDSITHIITPTTPVENSLPAVCWCEAYALVGNNIDICGPSRCMAAMLGKELDSKFTTPLKENYLDHFKDVDMFDQEHCKYCISNRNIIKNLKQVGV